jgi:hypothetical protein
MSTEFKTGQSVKITISRGVTRDAARKTLERLFMTDDAVAGPIHARSRNFKALPKRRGGRIWTKRPNKLELDLSKGKSASVTLTPQFVKDLRSVQEFVEVA